MRPDLAVALDHSILTMYPKPAISRLQRGPCGGGPWCKRADSTMSERQNIARNGILHLHLRESEIKNCLNVSHGWTLTIHWGGNGH